MKLFIASILMLSASAFAFDYNEREIHYVSWCVDNQVVANTGNNQRIVIADCSTRNLECQEQLRPQGRASIVSASCKDK